MDRHIRITAPPEKIAFRMSEASYVSGISKTRLYELINNGALTSIKAAGRRLILRDDLERFLASFRSASTTSDARAKSRPAPALKPTRHKEKPALVVGRPQRA